ncbi:VirD4-like conjugal transfer protein, CD1115 family [Paenibacillus sp. DYY-L-2]|uniref:VirD4-like conjugal transfer protein, CD1115 family n=1 Tax=Paenibacillus sp. DYY-L-2 TaxID=3447013 RepID=UPI003F4FA9AF
MKTSIKPAVFFYAVASLIVFYLFNRVALTIEGLEGNILENINAAADGILSSVADQPFKVGGTKVSLLAGLCGAILVWLAFLYNVIGSKKYMRGIEHGSAKWGTKRDIAPFINKEDEDQNLILSATEKLSMTPAKKFEHDRNKNVLVIGGSGSGKTFSHIKPNLMQLHSSYVITDPKGTLLPDTGHLFIENGYEVRSFNTINFTKSMHYNPLAYINNEKDILKLVNVLIENTKGEGRQSGEDFWVKAEKLWYSAAIGYLYYEAPMEERNIPALVDMLDMSGASEHDEDYQSPMDLMFAELERRKPDCFPVRQYNKFKQAAGKTMKSILISCGARLAPFDIQELREIMSYDELMLDEIGDRKTAFFVIMSDTDNTYSFIVAMMFYQMFNLLCDKADDRYGGQLPVHVRCMLDEFANIGKIPNFEKLISTIRSRNISATIILQSQSQLTSIYKEDADTITDCCDTLVFLGGKSSKTTKSISEMIGKTTIDNQNVNETKGQNASYSLNNQVMGRDLIDASEIGRLRRDECIVLISGLPPFKSQKYDTKKHKRFRYLADSGAKGKFEITATQSFATRV